MHNAIDHGYSTDWTIKVCPGLKILHRSAEGTFWLTVQRTHRDHGYWECVWAEGPRQGSYWVRSEQAILADAYTA